MKDDFEMARDHIRNNTMPTGDERTGTNSAAVYMEIGSVIECETDFMRSRGHCREGCSFAQLIQHPSAGVVCRWTMQNCKKIELAEIYSLYSLLNSDQPTARGFSSDEQGQVDSKVR